MGRSGCGGRSGTYRGGIHAVIPCQRVCASAGRASSGRASVKRPGGPSAPQEVTAAAGHNIDRPDPNLEIYVSPTLVMAQSDIAKPEGKP